MIRWPCAVMLLGANFLAGCSTDLFQTTAAPSLAETARASVPATKTMVTGTLPPVTPETAAAGTASAHGPADPPGLVAPDAGVTTLVRDTVHSDLFSKVEDEKPWPPEGSPEWRQQHAKDVAREHEIKERMRICGDC